MNMRIDIIVLTRNSEKVLRKCLASIYENVPVNKLIIVDGYSTDATLEIVEEFQEKYGNVVLIQDEGTRGSARQKGIREVETDWFMFVDSDVILCDSWFTKAEKLMKDDVGAIWGIEIWSVIKNTKILKLFERVTMKIFEKRGGTHDLLVRRKAIEGIHIPPHLHTYEDSYIRSWICKNGYKAVPAYKPYCIHYRPEIVWTIKESIALIANDLKFTIRSPQLLLSYAFYAAIVLYQNVLCNVKAKHLK
ncbi:MAG: glycosyltransferase family A protein [Candidatus Bathyarchaeia archaeon]|nr:glycosyltransferase family A protein [Candidatus Bathyarchaeia archaeon]